MYCPCFVLHLFICKMYCWWEGVLGIECGVMKYTATTGLFVCLFVWSRIFGPYFCHVVLYVRTSLVLACLNIENLS